MQKSDQENQELSLDKNKSDNEIPENKQKESEIEDQQVDIQVISKVNLNQNIEYANLNLLQLRVKAEQIMQQSEKNPNLSKRIEQIDQLCSEGQKYMEKIIFLIDEKNTILDKDEAKQDIKQIQRSINYYTTNLVISYLNHSILDKLQDLFLNFDQLTKEQKSLLVIFTCKLKACIEQIPKAIDVPLDDLFSVNKDHPKWQLIKDHISEKVLGDSQQIIQSYDKVCEGLLLGEALISIESEYKNIIKQNLMTGLGAIYYTVHKRQLKIRAQHFMAEASQEAAIKALNYSETQIGKAVLGLVLTPITFNEIIYLPKLFKPITRESLLHQYETGEINKINNDIGMQPQNNLEFEELFKQRKQRVQVRVLCHQNLQYVQESLFQQFLKLKQGQFNFEKVIIHLHGSGFVALSSYPHQIYTRKWAKSLQIPIFSVDYCKAPDHPYPEGLDDCWQTYMFIITFINQYFNINPKKVVLVGDSSGGNLCTSLTIQCIKAGVRVPDGMLLSYPSLQLDGRYFTPSILLCLDDSLLSHKVLNLCVESYIRPEFNTLIDPLISPFNASNEILSKFPKTRIIIGTHDPLHDESVRFLLKLVELGKDVRLVEYAAMPHGFLSLDVITGMKESKQAVIDAKNLLNELLT